MTASDSCSISPRGIDKWHAYNTELLAPSAECFANRGSVKPATPQPDYGTDGVAFYEGSKTTVNIQISLAS